MIDSTKAPRLIGKATNEHDVAIRKLVLEDNKNYREMQIELTKLKSDPTRSVILSVAILIAISLITHYI